LKDGKQSWQYGLLQNPSQKEVEQRHAPSAIRGPLGRIFYPIDKASIIADCLENQFRAHESHELCDCDHRQRGEAQVEALLATVDEDTPVNILPCEVSKEIQSTY
jgi:hypothetical protein